MEKLTNKAKDILENKELTCVICLGNEVYESSERGVKPVLDFLDKGMTFDGGCAADKVVGAGAAFLYVLLGVKEVYAAVLSKMAKEVLLKNGISVCYDVLVPKIQNRAKTGFCPIETSVLDETDPVAALIKIRETLKKLAK